MEITIESTRQPKETFQSSHINDAEQQKKDKVEMSKQPEASYDAVSSQGDTLYISETGRDANSGMNDSEKGQNEADGKVILKTAEENMPTVEDDISTINLSRYTESELRQMYLDGDITRSEYDEELGSREMEV